MSPAKIDLRAMLKDFGVQPKKGLGQNFLVDENVLARIAESSGADANTDVLEIGAGAGNLTRHLAEQARSVTAVEIDAQLIPVLRKSTKPYSNVRILQGDMLEQDIETLMPEPGFAVAANIPYYITSALIRYLLESPRKPRSILLTIQKEVAQRVCAKAGSLSLLALSVQVFGEPRILFRIPAEAFYPEPKVDSAVLQVTLYASSRIPHHQLDAFFRLAKDAFAQKRKMLHNTLAGSADFDKESALRLLASAEIESTRRAQTLTLDEWGRLTNAYLQEEY